MQISGINTKVATPANIPTPIIVLELNAIAYPHETPVSLYLIRSSLMVCGDIAIHIEETDTTFAIGWKGRYRLDGPAFVYSDHDTGRVATILGYPTDKLSQIA